MSAEALRVALLARPGVARERLRGVMDEAGVERVLEADPTELELAALLAASPRAVLVALDPATEDVLDRFDEVLFDPGVDVIYEEADLAATREGWDIARWQRHLVAKLQRHGDVLPPGREPDDQPAAAMPGESVVVDAVAFSEPPSASVAEALEISVEVPSGVGVEHEPLPAPEEAPTTTMEVSFAPMAGEANPFDPVLAESMGADDAAGFDDAFLSEFAAASELNPDASPALETDAFDPAVEASLAEEGFDQVVLDAGVDSDVDGPASAQVAVVAPATTIDFSNLSLDDGGEVASTASAIDDHRFRRDLDDLDQRISHLSLVDDTPQRGPEQARGAVVVLAGIGGPDAVRQLLGALPAGFPRPVLIQQRLDGARHDRLVAQMQRATSIPVKLAEAGAAADAATIYILPAEVGIEADDAGLRFNQSGDVLSQLPSADSAVLLLSGSDATQVDAVMNHSWAGALVAGQAADGCYDAAAPNALAARGGDTAPPPRIAQLLSERWA